MDPVNNDSFYCNKCINKELPFGLQTDETFNQTNILGLNNESNLENLTFKLSKKKSKKNQPYLKLNS